MKRKLLVTVISVSFLVGMLSLALGLIPIQASNGGNLVVNGGFEEPVVATPQDWDIYTSAEIPGWSVEWMPGPDTYNGLSRPAEASIELHREIFGAAAEGQQYAELDSDWDGPGGSYTGEPASVRIYQDLPTMPGEEYELTFDFSPRPDTDASNNILNVTWNGINVDIISAPGGTGTVWTEHTYTLTATGYVTRLAFTDMGTNDSLGTFLDDVSVVGPTPSGEETAWVCGEDFPGANWAMYLTYTVCDP